MKKIMLLLFAIISLTTVNAQNEQKGKITTEERIAKQIENIQTVTGCSKDQLDEIKVLLTSNFKKMDEIQTKYRGQKDRTEMKNEIEPIKAEFKVQLGKILTVEQFNKFEENRKATKPNDFTK